MPRLKTREDKKNKIQEKVEHIQALYDLIFERNVSYLNLKDFKKDLNLKFDGESFIYAGKTIMKEINLFKHMHEVYPEFKELNDIETNLKLVYAEIVSVLKKEFRNVRNEYRVVEID